MYFLALLALLLIIKHKLCTKCQLTIYIYIYIIIKEVFYRFMFYNNYKGMVKDMGLFGPNYRKVNRIVNKVNGDALRNAQRQGGCCGNCREYDSMRGVCTGPVTMAGKQPGHITSPDDLCSHWKI